jgi:hypothetical protein
VPGECGIQGVKLQNLWLFRKFGLFLSKIAVLTWALSDYFYNFAREHITKSQNHDLI